LTFPKGTETLGLTFTTTSLGNMGMEVGIPQEKMTAAAAAKRA
jgi:hypothetical protein